MTFLNVINSAEILLFATKFGGLRFQFYRILLKDLKEMGIGNFCSFFRLQKHLVQKFTHNFMWLWIRNILMRCDSKKLQTI